MKNYFPFIVILLVVINSCTKNIATVQQEPKQKDLLELYTEAMAFYDEGNYAKSASTFDEFFKIRGFNSSTSVMYNASCVYALNHEESKAFKYLGFIAEENFYSNFDHITSDPDLQSLNNSPKWSPLISKVQKNLEEAPTRNRKMITEELLAAKSILSEPASLKLWDVNLWSDKILVIDYDYTIYTLDSSIDGETKDSILYFTKADPTKLSFTNTTQDYNGKHYATVTIESVADSSSTIIHELFHLVHLKDKHLKADPISYLDEYEARELLRLEYAALRNTLEMIKQNQNIEKISTSFGDAFLFRKLRQSKYSSTLKDELELETVEGLANYTGIKLSSVSNKYSQTIEEINGREEADTYTRAFAYATGPAYGLIFDYLGINWKKGLDEIYNFLEIYENQQAEQVVISDSTIEAVRARCNYEEINTEELTKKFTYEKQLQHYDSLLLKSPTLKVTLPVEDYSISYNMYGTLSIKNVGLIYSQVEGMDLSNKAFGNFKTKENVDVLGMAGILNLDDTDIFIFPLPEKIEGNVLESKYYEMKLNEGWEIRKIDDIGNLEIVKI